MHWLIFIQEIARVDPEVFVRGGWGSKSTKNLTLQVLFILNSNEMPDLAAFQLGLHYFPKYLLMSFQSNMGCNFVLSTKLLI